MTNELELTGIPAAGNVARCLIGKDFWLLADGSTAELPGPDYWWDRNPPEAMRRPASAIALVQVNHEFGWPVIEVRTDFEHVEQVVDLLYTMNYRCQLRDAVERATLRAWHERGNRGGGEIFNKLVVMCRKLHVSVIFT